MLGLPAAMLGYRFIWSDHDDGFAFLAYSDINPWTSPVRYAGYQWEPDDNPFQTHLQRSYILRHHACSDERCQPLAHFGRFVEATKIKYLYIDSNNIHNYTKKNTITCYVVAWVNMARACVAFKEGLSPKPRPTKPQRA